MGSWSFLFFLYQQPINVLLNIQILGWCLLVLAVAVAACFSVPLPSPDLPATAGVSNSWRATALQSLAPTLINHTWSNLSSPSGSIENYMICVLSRDGTELCRAAALQELILTPLCYRVIHVCYNGVIYLCSSSISYMLTTACCGCIGSSKSRFPLPQQQRSRSIRPRQNTLTLSCTLPCQSFRKLLWQKYNFTNT